MAHRTKAVLYMKLAQRTVADQEKNQARQGIYFHVKKALELNPEDLSLCKMILDLCPFEENVVATKQVMEFILLQEKRCRDKISVFK